jgi:tetrahydromethanopterin S-methyltransferase subunit G
MNEWLTQHWAELMALLGVGATGAGGSVLGHKLIDKQQNATLKQHDNRLDNLEKKVTNIESEVKINSTSDQQFRNEIGHRLGSIENLNNKILEHLLKSK